MITDSFYLENDNQMLRGQQYIKANMPTARFFGNPFRSKNGRWGVTLTYEIEDINKLNVLFRTFELEEARAIAAISKPSPWQKIKNILKSKT